LRANEELSTSRLLLQTRAHVTKIESLLRKATGEPSKETYKVINGLIIEASDTVIRVFLPLIRPTSSREAVLCIPWGSGPRSRLALIDSAASELRVNRENSRLVLTSQVAHSPGRIGYASGKLPYNRHLGKVKPNCLKSPVSASSRSKLLKTPFCGNQP
jgi:hypothetical protein